MNRNKASRKSAFNRAILASAIALTIAPTTFAAPSGGTVTSGTGSISHSGSTTTITQNTQHLSLNWDSFNVGSSESVNYLQPSASSIAINRILDNNGSQILGKLTANGQVYLINPNGILFGQGAQVNVGGLVASTLNIDDADLANSSRTFSGNGSGSIVNQGTLTAPSGGYIALLANRVSNNGVINATLGTAALAAGSQVTLDFNGDQLLTVQVDKGALDALAENKQLIQADGGAVLMTAQAADALTTAVVNNTGVIEAHTLVNRNGHILLLGDMTNGTVNVGGMLDASAPTSGDGGFIETSAAHVHVAPDTKVTTIAENGANGTWLIDPVDFTIAASGGDMTGAAVGTALAGGNFTIMSTSGANGTSGDINVNDAVAWSANTLTLNAQNNINISANLDGSGGGSLALLYGQANVNAGNTSNYYLSNGAQVNLAAGNNFSTKLGSDGATTTWTVITSLGTSASSGDGTLTIGSLITPDVRMQAAVLSTYQSGTQKPAGLVKAVASDVLSISDGGIRLTITENEIFKQNEMLLKQGAIVRFESNSNEPLNMDVLNRIANAAVAANITLMVVGYADAVGSDVDNRALSMRRAERVKNLLTAQGVNVGIIRSAGNGEADPVADNETDEGRAQNRRVLIKGIGVGDEV